MFSTTILPRERAILRLALNAGSLMEDADQLGNGALS